jgi:hypothetical protein
MGGPATVYGDRGAVHRAARVTAKKNGQGGDLLDGDEASILMPFTCVS